jgi:hypothetical protein
MNKAKKMDSCKELFKSMKIFPLYSQYIYSLLMYVANNKHLFTRNLEVHNHDTRSAKNFHLPITKLTIYQKGAYYTGIKIFNYLPNDIKNVANEIQFCKKTLKRFLLDNSFYSTDEYFNANKLYTFLIVMIS